MPRAGELCNLKAVAGNKRFGSVTVSVCAVRFGGSVLSEGSGRFGSRSHGSRSKALTSSRPLEEPS